MHDNGVELCEGGEAEEDVDYICCQIWKKSHIIFVFCRLFIKIIIIEYEKNLEVFSFSILT